MKKSLVLVCAICFTGLKGYSTGMEIMGLAFTTASPGITVIAPFVLSYQASKMVKEDLNEDLKSSQADARVFLANYYQQNDTDLSQYEYLNSVVASFKDVVRNEEGLEVTDLQAVEYIANYNF